MIRSSVLTGVLLLFVACSVAEGAEAAAKLPIATLTVHGRGEVAASPDQAVVRLGAVVQAPAAASAQQQVNRIMERAVKGVRSLKIPPEMITTSSLTLEPVYSRSKSADAPEVLKVIGYRASDTIQVQTDDLNKIGKVIDTAVAAGANRVEGISFRLRNDSKYRREALRLAVQQARTEAEAIAGAMHVRIVGVSEIAETGARLMTPQLRMSGAYLANAATPVQPGQIRVEAGVTVRYRIEVSPSTGAGARPRNGAGSQP